MSSHPVISFATHIARTGNRAGAREEFEEMLGLLVRAVTGKDAHLIAADPGDWGIDVLASDLNGRAAVWQAKYFIDGVRENQCKEIRKSFEAAVSNSSQHGYAIQRWVLCVPVSLGPRATLWWQRWAARQARATGIDIELWDETRLTEELLKPEAAHVRQAYYPSWSPPPRDGQADGGESRFLEVYRDQLRQYYGYLELPNPRRRDRVPVQEIYVPLGIREPAAVQAARDTPTDGAGLTMADLPGLIDRTVLLGDPGGGKSAACSVLMDHFARDPQAKVPFLVLLRELYAPGQARKGVARHIEVTLASRHHCRPPRGLLERMLREGSAFVIFEGLDEVLDIPERRAAALCIEQFCHAYPGVQVLVTSRGEAYGQGRLDAEMFKRYELGAFGREEAAEYVRRWFRWHGEPAPVMSVFPGEGTYDAELRSSPLLLSLICTLYRETGVLPRDRVDLYERCTDMLIRRWDEAKEIRRELKAEVMIRPLIQHLALWVMSLPDANAPVAESDLTREVERFLLDNTPGPAGDLRAPAEEFVEFCRERAWVLSSVTIPRGRSEYRFTHQAFLEYYAAAGLVQQAKTPEALATALAPRIIHSWHFSQLAVSVMARSAPGMADRMCELLLRQQDLPGDRGELLTFLTTLLRDMPLSPDTVRGLSRSILRHRILPDPQREVTHPLGMLLFLSDGGHMPVVTDHRESVSQEFTSYISAMTTSGDMAARAEGLRMLLEARDASLSDYWKEWTQEQAARRSEQIRESSARSRELRTLALSAGLLSLDLALGMPGALDALLEPFGSMLDSNLQFPYPVWMYMQADGMVAAGEAAEQEFAVIGRYIAEHPGLPWVEVDSRGFSISDLYHRSALAEIGEPLDEMTGLGLAAMHVICYELFNSCPEDFRERYPDMYGRYLPEVPMPSRLIEVFRGWAEHEVNVTAPQ